MSVPGREVERVLLANRQPVEGTCVDPSEPGCTVVSPSAYEIASGWVTANGAFCAIWHSIRTSAYTQLGRALFQEVEPGTAGQARTQLEKRPAHRSGDGAC